MPLCKRLTTPGALLVGVFLALTASAVADPVQIFNANTTGAFGVGTCAGCTLSGGNTTISNTGGGGSSSISFLTSGAEVTAELSPGQSANVTLGVFNSTSTVASGTLDGPNFTGSNFTLNVSFTLPNDASPNPGVFTATLTGQVVLGASGAQVLWNSPTTLNFTSPTAGTFSLLVESFTPINTPLDPNNNRIRAVLTYQAGPAAPIPEPATLLLLGTGLAGAAAARRRRRAKRREQAS